MSSSPETYLDDILTSQTLAEDSTELKALRDHRAAVEKLLRKHYPNAKIRYGGSKAKGTMIKESYDLDLTCYFADDDTTAGETLRAIYNDVEAKLASDYAIERKPSALRLRGTDTARPDCHIDVVPGRFTDGDDGDVFLFQASGEKERLKTNLDVHIAHVKDSGVRDAIRLMKLWKIRHAVGVRNFVLELLVIDLLKGKASKSLPVQLKHLWSRLSEDINDLTVEDPANPTGNDLSELLNASVRLQLSTAAAASLKLADDGKWEQIFGSLPDESRATEALRRAPAVITAPTKPWSRRG